MAQNILFHGWCCHRECLYSARRCSRCWQHRLAAIQAHSWVTTSRMAVLLHSKIPGRLPQKKMAPRWFSTNWSSTRSPFSRKQPLPKIIWHKKERPLVLNQAFRSAHQAHIHSLWRAIMYAVLFSLSFIKVSIKSPCNFFLCYPSWVLRHMLSHLPLFLVVCSGAHVVPHLC